MKAGTLLVIVADLISALERLGVINAAGEFVEPAGADGYAALALEVEAILKKHGVEVPANVDRAIKGLPLVLALAGLK